MPMKVRYTTINGEVIAENRNGVRKQYVPDPLGSTVALLDDTQTITDTFSYWPYGEVATRSGSTATPFQFAGAYGYYSSGITNVYVRHRYLSDVNGTWISEDPIGFDDVNWNLYRYAWNSPNNVVDASGLFCQKIGLDCYGNTCTGNANCPTSGCFANVSCKCKMSSCCVVIGEGHMDVVKTAQSCGCETYEGLFPDVIPGIQRNIKWIKGIMDRGCTILDIGPTVGLSPYYRAEKQAIADRNYGCASPTARIPSTTPPPIIVLS